MLDPPEHTAFRKLVSRGFTPRAVREVEPEVRAYVVEQARRLRRRGRGRHRGRAVQAAAEHGGGPLPRRPGRGPRPVRRLDRRHRRRELRRPPDRGRGRDDGDARLLRRADRAPPPEPPAGTTPCRTWSRPGSGTTTPGCCSILGYVFAMVTGGNDTTTGALGGAVQLLAEHPDQRALLVADPTLVKDAVEEFLRLTSPVQGLARTTTRDVELHDVTIPAGRKVLLCYGAANRDPRKYGADAERLDVRRQPDPDPHLQPGQPPLHRQRGRADDGPGGARGAARPHPVVHRRPRRCHLGARPLRPPPAHRPAVDPVHGMTLARRGPLEAGGREDPRRRRRAVRRARHRRRLDGRRRQGRGLLPRHPLPLLRGPSRAARGVRPSRGPARRRSRGRRRVPGPRPGAAAGHRRSSPQCDGCGRRRRCRPGSPAGTPRRPPSSPSRRR